MSADADRHEGPLAMICGGGSLPLAVADSVSTRGRKVLLFPLRGAAGLWIENGTLGFPVSEVTIAGHLRDIFANLEPANDLAFRYGTNAPTVRVEGLTVAGE